MLTNITGLLFFLVGTKKMLCLTEEAFYKHQILIDICERTNLVFCRLGSCDSMI